MPYILGYIHTIAAVFLTKDNAFGNCAVIVVGGHTNLSTKYNKSLILVGMMMDGNIGSGFQGIEHTVAQIIKRLMKVVVLAQPRRSLGLC